MTRTKLDIIKTIPRELRAHVSEVRIALAKAEEARAAYERAYDEERRLHQQAGGVDLDAPGLTREAAMPMLKWSAARDDSLQAGRDLYDADIQACRCMLRYAEVEVATALEKLDDARRAEAAVRGRGAAAELFALCDLKEARDELERWLGRANEVKADQDRLSEAEHARPAEIDARDTACLAEANRMAASKLEEVRRLFELEAAGKA